MRKLDQALTGIAIALTGILLAGMMTKPVDIGVALVIAGIGGFVIQGDPR
jgi:hypothetical protein